MHKYDVIIAGGAIIGSASAWFLSRDPAFDGSVLVVEKDPTYSECSTTLSVSSIRQQFSSAVNVLISQFGFEFLKSVEQRTAGEGGIGLVERGYLLLADAGGEERLRRNSALQQGLGADTALLDRGQIKARWPWLNVDDVAIAGYGESGEGWFDPWSLLQFFKRGAVDRGVRYVRGEVAGLEMRGGGVTGVNLADGSRYACGHFVNAAGTGASAVARMAGIEVQIEPRKRCVFVFDCREGDTIVDCPHLIDFSGVYLKPWDRHFITGGTPPADRDLPCTDFEVDYTQFDDFIWPVLAHRVPVFEAIRVVSAWAGHYAYNVLDQNAIIGPHPEIPNFLFANGFSGHGIQQAPAVGRAIAECVAHGKYVSLDLSDLGFERVVQGRPFPEKNVY